MRAIELIKALLKKGWVIERIHGSHYVLKKGEQTEVIPAHGGKDLPKGLAEAIKKRRNL